MSWNNVMPASAINIPATEYPPEGAFVAPKSSRGRKPSKWQLTPCKLGVWHGQNNLIIIYDNEKQAKAALSFARAFGYIPDDPRVSNY